MMSDFSSDAAVFGDTEIKLQILFPQRLFLLPSLRIEMKQHTLTRAVEPSACASIWLCSGGGVGHGSEPVAVNRAQSSA